MSKHQRRVVSVLASWAAIAFLAGCAASSSAGSSTPEPSVGESSTPIAEEPAVQAHSIDKTGVSTLDEAGDVISTIEYTVDGAAAIDFLSEAFGSDPVVSPRPGDASCVAEAMRAVWGDDAFELVYDFPGLSGIPDGQSVAVDAKSAAVGEVAVQTPEGVSVGDPVNALVVALPNAGTHTNPYEPSQFSVDYAVAAGEYEDFTDPDFGMTENAYWGAQAVAVNDVITALKAPTYFQSAC